MVSLEQALAEVERPTAHLPRLVGQTLATRLYGSRRLHRAVPTPLALRLAALRGRLEWHLVPRRRAHALRLTEMIRGLSPETPEAAVFDATGRLVYHGRIDDRWVEIGKARPQAQTHDLEDAIAAVLAGRPVARAETRAVGCTLADLE